jgi:DNA-binding transcriptional ArsR family regulator
VQPLAGLLVADFSRYTPGPFATRELLRLGARVVCIEPPEGDPLRAAAPGWHDAINAGKESVLCDLKSEPELGRALLARSTQRAVRVEAQRAISQLARVEDRLVALFGMLAERFARVTPAGVVITVHLTHAMLGRLVGARRPTVSLALKSLADEALIARREDGSWLLSHQALDGLRSATGQAPPSRAEARLLEPAAEPAAVAPIGRSIAERRELDDRAAATLLHTKQLQAQSRRSLARSVALRGRAATSTRGAPERPAV